MVNEHKINTWGNRSIWKELCRQRWLYIFLLPALIFCILFLYKPMYGVLIAFQEYGMNEIIEARSALGNNWIGLDNFKAFLSREQFWLALINTVRINTLQILICFPAPIVLAILLTEVRSNTIRRVTQSITYLPYFISWVITAGLIYRVLDVDTGVFNMIRKVLNLGPVAYMRYPQYFLGVYTITTLWKGIGWNSIIYCSAITGIDPTLYEAAIIDGAGRFRRIWHITLPGITPMIVLLLIMTISGFFSSSFEAILTMRNAMISSASDTIEIFTYFRGIVYSEYGYATSIGLTQSLVSLTMLAGANVTMKKLTGYSLL